MATGSLLFIVTSLIALGLFYVAGEKDGQILKVFGVWGLTVAGLSYQGFYQDSEAFPPRMISVLLPATLLVVYFYHRLRDQRLTVVLLLAIHLVRVPVEWGLYMLFQQAMVPRIMTFEGWNFDILSGLSAALLLIIAQVRPDWLTRRLLYLWNTAALILLIIIVVTGILSAPSPVQLLAFDQPNQALLRFPFTLLPGVIVPIVLLAHLLLYRQLRIPES